jgi:hypothetical protein
LKQKQKGGGSVEQAWGALEGRQFVREGPVHLVGAAGEAERRQLFLFSDVIFVLPFLVLGSQIFLRSLLLVLFVRLELCLTTRCCCVLAS